MALTIRQPWAWAIAVAGKDVENRTWRTAYRGPLAIHAGLADDGAAVLPRELRESWLTAGKTGLSAAAAAHGAVIAVAELAGCHAHDPAGTGWVHDGQWVSGDRCSLWALPGEWHWQLRDVRPLAAPVPCTGRLGLWRLPGRCGFAIAEQTGGPR